MRPIYFDTGVRFDDPNARLGDPAYLLEPGDAGYVADPRSASFPPHQPNQRNKPMPKSDYVKAAMLAFSQQLLTFKNNITPYVTTLSLTAGEVTTQAADADRFKWEVDMLDICGNCAQQWAAWLDITRHGGTPPATGAPLPVTPPAPEPPAVAPGVEARFRRLVAKCKVSTNFSPAIAEVLGIRGEEITGPDFSVFGPVLKLTLDAAGVMVRWGWQGFGDFLDACEIQVDRNDGQGFKLLAIDTTPNYLDTTPMPSAPGKWTYKAVYRVGDGRVGQWSAPVSLTVG